MATIELHTGPYPLWAAVAPAAAQHHLITRHKLAAEMTNDDR
jgi:hypothetical protein